MIVTAPQQRRRLGFWAVFFPVLGMVAGLVFFGLAVWERDTSDIILRDGVSIQAEVVGRQVEEDRDHNRATHVNYYYLVTYQFIIKDGPQAGSYLNRQQVGRSTYDKLLPDTRIEVKYLANDPHQSRLAGENADLDLFVTFLLIGLGLFALSTLVLLKNLSELRHGKNRGFWSHIYNFFVDDDW